MRPERRGLWVALTLTILAPLLTQCQLRNTPARALAGAVPIADSAATDGPSLQPGVVEVPTPSGGVITGLDCFSCHNPLQDNEGRLRFSHDTHRKQDLHCSACHTSEDHLAAPAELASQTHAWGVSRHCAACHDGKKAADGCRVCHTDANVIKPETHRRADFPRGHGNDGSAASCRSCHEQSQCDNCHGLSLPHPAGFRAGHGPMAKQRSELCGTCHDPQWCTACHNGMPMPHPAGFITVHGRMDQRKCGTCHERAECQSCHQESNPHPTGFGADHKVAATGNKPACATCHSQSYCDNCHGLRLPHAVGFDKNHGAPAKSRPASCLKCHRQAECDSCHGRPMPHPPGFTTTHGSEALGGSEDCGRCHTSTECRACHGTTMPHPRDYIYGHNNEARYGQSQPCAKCHQTDFCGQCHSQEQLSGETVETNAKKPQS